VTDFNDGYDDFLNEAAKDDRVGKHRGVVIALSDGTWESKNGEAPRPYTNVSFKLTSGSEIDLRWTVPPDPPPTKDEMAAMDKGIRMGIVNSVTLRRQLAQHFGKSFQNLKEGDEVGMLIELQKSKKDGKSYPRVRAFIPLESCDVEKPKSDDIPF
jgi:hypothetical protein